MAHLINDTRSGSGPVLTKQARDTGLTTDDARFALHRALHTTDPGERRAAVAWLARNDPGQAADEGRVRVAVEDGRDLFVQFGQSAAAGPTDRRHRGRRQRRSR
ncbi:MAG: hypothetical protein J2P15_08720 [Micromonosporaceae bacterium]|nr:hypothetical protein [Micromonosporaceae bacterium]